jgi:inorganic pyrophosphatase
LSGLFYELIPANCSNLIIWCCAPIIRAAYFSSSQVLNLVFIFMRIDAIPAGMNAPEDVNVIVEVPTGGEPIKYEMDKESGALFVDRYLYTPMRYPGNYGFVPHTLSDDGDPIDVLVASTRAIAPGAVLNCRPIGVLIMSDEAGQDEKILAVPSTKLTRRYENVINHSDLPEITLHQIEHFFAHYKDLESDKWVKIERWGDAADAKKLIQEAVERYESSK